MNPEFLEVRGFEKRFGNVTAVAGVNLKIAKGEFLTFLGPSGSGKSTTLYAIAGFENPTQGDILLSGSSILSVPSHKRNIGMVFQRYTLFPHLTVGENVAFPLRVRKMDDGRVRARVAEMLALVRLEGFQDRKPAQLSGGQQQRVALARALAYEPPVLLMDEPLSALDKKLREEIQIEIRRIHRETGVTILYVTHDQEEALRLSDRIAVFNRGCIEQIADGKTLYQSPGTRFVAGFIGDSNFLTVKSSKKTSSGVADVVLPDGTHLSHVRIHSDMKQQELMVRPQSVHFETKRSGQGIAVTIKDVTFLGDSQSVLLETKWGQELWAKAQVGAISGLEAGQAGFAIMKPADCHLF